VKSVALWCSEMSSFENNSKAAAEQAVIDGIMGIASTTASASTISINNIKHQQHQSSITTIESQAQQNNNESTNIINNNNLFAIISFIINFFSNHWQTVDDCARDSF
jgi:hypothetical protein